MISWETGVPWTGWSVSYSTVAISHLSTPYVYVPFQARKAGSGYDPTSDTVQFAFMPTATQVPQVSDWQAGSWDSNPPDVIYPYNAKCLVGPSGTVTLGVGTYVMYVQVTDSPEVIVLVAGQLQVS